MIKKKLFGGLALGIASVVSGGVALACGLWASAQDEIVLPETAYLGTTIEIPEKTFTYSGQEWKASVMVTAPDGGEFTGNVFSAEQIGKYSIEYYAIANGQRVSFESDSVMITRRASDMFETNDTASVENGAFIHNENIKGVRLALGNGGVATFTRIFNVNELTMDKPLIEFIAEGTQEGKTDFSNMTVTIADVEDPDNAVTVYMVDSTTNCEGKATYTRVGATGQLPAGYELADRLHTLPQFGTALNHTFKKQAEGHNYKTAKLYFDYANKAMYGSDNYYTGEKMLIADMDSPTDFSLLWNGFTSGKVRISVAASGLSTATANIVVTNVLGYDLSVAELPDTTAPDVKIDYNGEGSVPVALMGKQYRVFDAIVRDDLDNDVKMDVSVYYQPTLDSTEIVDVDVQDGFFRTDMAGIYTIHYVASDYSGNVAEQDVQVVCAVGSAPIAMETTDVDRTVAVQEKVTIGGVASVTAVGGNGNLVITAEVTSPSGEAVKLDRNSFITKEIGVYTICYKATDYLGISVEKQVYITVETPEKPIFAEALYMPDVLVKGLVYELPSQLAKEANNGAMVDATVKVYVNGTENTEGKFAASGESVEIKYVASGKTGETERVLTLPVVDGNNGKDQEKYFYGDHLTNVTNDKDYVTVGFAQDANVAFVNALQTKNFHFGYMISEASNFTEMKICLTDAANKELTVTLSMVKRDGIWYLRAPYSTVEAQFTDSKGSFELTYKNATRAITDKNGNSCGTIDYNDKGEVFTGFSDTVYMSVSYGKVLGESDVYWTLLNNQPLGYRSTKFESRRDRIAPELYLKESYQVKNTLGAKAKISAVDAYDVLGYVKVATVTVTAPDGKKVLDGVSAFEFYEIDLTQYGNYRVEYYVQDSNGANYSEGKVISVVEMEKPTLKVMSIKSEYKLGDSITIPGYEISDNSGEYSVDVMLILPSNELRLLLHDENGEITSKLAKDDISYNASFKVDENTFKLESEGTYILRFFAYDSNFNYVTVEFTFTVTA